MTILVDYHPGDIAYIIHENKICTVTVHEVAISVTAGKEPSLSFDIPSFDADPEVSMNYVVVKGNFQNDPKKVLDTQKMVVDAKDMFPTPEGVAEALLADINK